MPIRPALPSLLNHLYRIDAAMVRPLPCPSRMRPASCSLQSSTSLTTGIAPLQARCETAFAARPFATSADSSEAAGRTANSGQRASQRRATAAGGSAVVAEQEGFSAITDKHIPQRPVSPVEATSYTVVIIAGASRCDKCRDTMLGPAARGTAQAAAVSVRDYRLSCHRSGHCRSPRIMCRGQRFAVRHLLHKTPTMLQDMYAAIYCPTQIISPSLRGC